MLRGGQSLRPDTPPFPAVCASPGSDAAVAERSSACHSRVTGCAYGPLYHQPFTKEGRHATTLHLDPPPHRSSSARRCPLHSPRLLERGPCRCRAQGVSVGTSESGLGTAATMRVPWSLSTTYTWTMVRAPRRNARGTKFEGGRHAEAAGGRHGNG